MGYYELKNWILHKKLDNIIFVADRAYFNYDLFKIFNNNNYKYVICIKENAQIDKTIKKNK